jgi:ATP-dependent DNA helicase RecG
MLFPEYESSTLEFKETIPEKNQILKTAIGFSNMYGGRLIIGVRNDREITGIPEDTIESLLEFLHKSIYENCAPPIYPMIFTQRFGDRLVLIIRIEAGTNKPYHLRSEGVVKGTYVRMGRSTLRADVQTRSDLQNCSRGITGDAVPLYAATADSIDSDKVKAFLIARTAGFKGMIDQRILHAYTLIREEQTHMFPTIGGILLFAEQPQQWLTEAFIICSRFKGTSGRTADATHDCTGTLFEQFEAAYDFILGHLDKSFVIRGKRRLETYEVPPVAVREILVNAIVHRNYAIAAPTKIAVFDNRIEVFSPGNFPGPLDVHHLNSGITYIRNPVITKVFREAGYMEKLGTGFLTVFRSYEEMGLARPQVIEGENYIKCILPREKSVGDADSDSERILQLLRSCDSVSVADIVRQLDMARATAGRRLAVLLNDGKIRRTGKGRACRYYRAG